ncbi:hypothetical protein [Streptomyces melanogenes]|uniref:hypothetical protein n=1 Tax=Streptomyces melanogenes TaxID=67326 RepID=UPI00167C6E0A|nr:hypothetical protein [Streptomyces melanogenes]GGP90815.1 hypothetical protein GCM10010278_81440 [Streptomyces melanogenes]
MPRRTRAAIVRVEAQLLGYGSVAQALDQYRRFLRRPGRYLYLPWDPCPCCDPAEARDTLEEALRHMPPAARAGLRKIVAPLDEEFHRRTLPNPWSPSVDARHAAAWWRHRIREI